MKNAYFAKKIAKNTKTVGTVLQYMLGAGGRKMLAELRIELDTDNQDIGYYQSSNFQGVLMEQIDYQYAEKLHHQKINPYSQSILKEKDRIIWSIKTLQEEAFQNIIKVLQRDSFTEINLTKKMIKLRICSKELIMKDKKELLQEFYQKPGDRYLNMEFMTPTSFKSEGRYVIIPEVRYIYQSLMNKYSATSGEEIEMFDIDTLEQLIKYSEITKYRLKSTCFPLEGIKIPAFKGELTIKMQGTDTMARYARFLLHFGEYSGIGMKTAMGMGAIKLK